MTIIRQAWRWAKMARRAGGVRGAWRTARDGGKYVQLFRRLLADPAVPPAAKAILLGAAVFAVSPLNVPQYLPVVGALDDLGILLIAGRYFLGRVPPATLAAHRRAVGLAEAWNPA